MAITPEKLKSRPIPVEVDEGPQTPVDKIFPKTSENNPYLFLTRSKFMETIEDPNVGLIESIFLLGSGHLLPIPSVGLSNEIKIYY
jgi:hypothetical protein